MNEDEGLGVKHGVALGLALVVIIGAISLLAGCVTPQNVQEKDAAYEEFVLNPDGLPADERLERLEADLAKVAQDVKNQTVNGAKAIGGALTGNGLLDLVLTGVGAALAGGAGANSYRNRKRARQGEPF